MSALSERLAGGLWLDYVNYAGRLLANGAVPWLDVDGANGWMRKAQSLLKSDVAVLPVGLVVSDWLQAHPELITSMAAKRRSVYPVKMLLADEPLRLHLMELARVLRAGLPKLPLLLAIPSPKAWLVQAYAQANADEITEADEDAVDSAAAYIADFLRVFADSGIDGVVLEETSVSEPATAADLALYQPLFNVAAHYRWEVGLRLPLDGRFSVAVEGLAFALAPRAMPGVPTGIAVPPGFWGGEAAPLCSAGNFRYAEIPAESNPERVLERLAALR